MDRVRARIEGLRIRGFRSLADIAVEGLSDVTVMIGANGSGKSNLIRFFEMLGWMLGASRLQEFVQRQGGADDQLFGGRGQTPQLEADLRLETDAGRNDYRFVLAHAHPDRLIFLEEAFRFSRAGGPDHADWHDAGSAHAEAGIVDIARPAAIPHPGQKPLQRSSIFSAIAPRFNFTIPPMGPDSSNPGMLATIDTCGPMAAIRDSRRDRCRRLSNGPIEELRQIHSGFDTQEDIDDGAQTAPSKRITGIFREYRKALHGPLIAETIGMQAIRKQCPRFNEWVGRLSRLGAAN